MRTTVYFFAAHVGDANMFKVTKHIGKQVLLNLCLLIWIKCIHKIYFREEQLRQDQEREEIRQLEIERLKQIQVSFFSLKKMLLSIGKFLIHRLDK